MAYTMSSMTRLGVNRSHMKPCGKRVAVTCQASQPTQDAIAKRRLGKSDVEVSEIGIGAWSWGDRSNYWQGWTKDGSKEAYVEAMNAGCTFIDTAEVYGFGQSEEFIGEFMKTCETASKPSIATKYAPLPWRQTAGSVVQACDASLQRLGVDQIDLYIQHWPGFFLNAFSNKATLEGLLQCLQQGKTRAVGVSNFNEQRVRDAARFFEANGACLSSNQVQYSLLYREPERNGVLEACREQGVTLVAYSPICQGLLSCKYSAGNIPKGPRSMYFTDARFSQVSVLLDLLQTISKDSYNGEKSPSQIAINWLLCKDVLPIPGAKNGDQVKELVGACGWRLTEGEVQELDAISQNIPSSTGAPFEKW
jgi:aryl-alcohol dehydrogenase-like predicted oxidoreductase